MEVFEKFIEIVIDHLMEHFRIFGMDKISEVIGDFLAEHPPLLAIVAGAGAALALWEIATALRKKFRR
ncbi:hypothetical protein [Nitrospirillum iridis]|uniref:Uncharacterized protein n=1 Tax=Nitrospirillum iridis TaxID=765888 RepID=A0A7X0EDU9_9PROT|nr:hypothetical protein [Nitrospirillum iridis]MBB6253168.1 hypothetical protein [Nitrospirillum iridis]